MGFEPPWNDGSAVGDRIVPMARTEEESERMRLEFARRAEEDQPGVVQHLRAAMALVLEDFGIDSGSRAVETLWMTSEKEHEISPSVFRNARPDLPGDWWRGLVYLNGERHLSIEIDASRPQNQLTYYIAFAIQDTIEEEFGRPRPRCPLHPHALEPMGTLTGGVWACPHDGTLWWCYIGGYQRARQGRGPGG